MYMKLQKFGAKSATADSCFGLIVLFIISESMHGMHACLHAEYILAPPNTPSPYIYMGQKVNYRARAASQLTGCPNATNINRKYNLSLTLYKLSCLMKMIVRKAIVRQRHQYLTAKIVSSTTKQKK